MGKRTPVGSYRLSVKDFGPIARAEVDLRPLTVFLGPGNTGKSYLATLIYVIHRVLEHSPRSPRRRSVRRRVSFRSDYLPRWMFNVSHKIKADDETRRALTAWLEDAKGIREASVISAQYASDPLGQLVRKELKGTAEWGEFFGEEMKRCFGVDSLGNLVRKAGAGAAINLSLNGDSTRFDLKISGKNVAFSPDVPDSFSLARSEQIKQLLGRPGEKSFGSGFDKDCDDSLRELLINLIDVGVSNLIEPIMTDNAAAFYLPAGRTGVMHSHQALVSALIQSATIAGLRPPPDAQMLPGVLGDFLQHLVNVGEAAPSTRRDKRDLADLMEREILGGKVKRVRSPAGYPTFRYQPAGWKGDGLPLTRASSMVSELAPVVLYLRYLVRPGDVLIIEEPESHLHPRLQVVLARHLARLARSGVRVIVTTHSEWLLDQFANLVRLSELVEFSESQAKGIHDPDEALRPDQFGAWLFKPKQRPKGSVVKEIKINLDDGGLLVDYTDVAERLYNEWAEIGNRIEESKP